MKNLIKDEIRKILKNIENELEDIDFLNDGGADIATNLRDISDEIRRSLRLDIEVTLYNGDSFEIIGVKVSTWSVMGKQISSYHATDSVICREHETGECPKINFYAREGHMTNKKIS